jgi:hypothetical protein
MKLSKKCCISFVLPYIIEIYEKVKSQLALKVVNRQVELTSPISGAIQAAKKKKRYWQILITRLQIKSHFLVQSSPFKQLMIEIF